MQGAKEPLSSLHSKVAPATSALNSKPIFVFFFLVLTVFFGCLMIFAIGGPASSLFAGTTGMTTRGAGGVAHRRPRRRSRPAGAARRAGRPSRGCRRRRGTGRSGTRSTAALPSSRAIVWVGPPLLTRPPPLSFGSPTANPAGQLARSGKSEVAATVAHRQEAQVLPPVLAASSDPRTVRVGLPPKAAAGADGSGPFCRYRRPRPAALPREGRRGDDDDRRGAAGDRAAAAAVTAVASAERRGGR